MQLEILFHIILTSTASLVQDCQSVLQNINDEQIPT